MTNEQLIQQMLIDLKIYGGCSVCIHNDFHKIVHACELGGCRGGGNGKIKEDRWEYRHSIPNGNNELSLPKQPEPLIIHEVLDIEKK